VNYDYETMDRQALAISDFLSEQELYHLETPFALLLGQLGFEDQMSIIVDVAVPSKSNPSKPLRVEQNGCYLTVRFNYVKRSNRSSWC